MYNVSTKRNPHFDFAPDAYALESKTKAASLFKSFPLSKPSELRRHLQESDSLARRLANFRSDFVLDATSRGPKIPEYKFESYKHLAPYRARKEKKAEEIRAYVSSLPYLIKVSPPTRPSGVVRRLLVGSPSLDSTLPFFRLPSLDARPPSTRSHPCLGSGTGSRSGASSTARSRSSQRKTEARGTGSTQTSIASEFSPADFFPREDDATIGSLDYSVGGDASSIVFSPPAKGVALAQSAELSPIPASFTSPPTPHRTLPSSVVLPNVLPPDVVYHILAFLPTSSVFDYILHTLLLIMSAEPSLPPDHPLKLSLPEIVSSFWHSGHLGRSWSSAVADHRAARRAGLDAGDLNVDVEGSMFPKELGTVDQDVPAWQAELDEDDIERIKLLDKDMKHVHMTMLGDVFDLLLKESIGSTSLGPTYFKRETSRSKDREHEVEISRVLNSEGDRSRESEAEAPAELYRGLPGTTGGEKTRVADHSADVAAEEERTLALAIADSLQLGGGAATAAIAAVVPSAVEDTLTLPPVAVLNLFGADGSNISSFFSCLAKLRPALLSSVRSLDVSGCTCDSSLGFASLLLNLPNLRVLRCKGLRSWFDVPLAVAIGSMKSLQYLDLSSCDLDDAALVALAKELRATGKIRKLSLANSGRITDAGIKAAGEAIAGLLSDLCISGCFRVSDSGLMMLGFGPRLRRLNFCGCYKVTDASRRWLCSQNPSMLIYNKSSEFGMKAHGVVFNKSYEFGMKAQGPTDDEDMDDLEDDTIEGENDAKEGLEKFRRRMNGF